MKSLPTIHPGEVLLKQFLAPRGISRNALARSTGLSPGRIERGSRWTDLLQLRELCQACGQSLAEFVDEFEQELGEVELNRRSTKRPSR